jgi:hypothetical protein
MHYLQEYYKNLCEQLQSQIDLLEKRFDISQFNKSKKSGKKDEKKGDKKDDKKSGKKADKKANKDYDGDGEVESSKDEYFGSKDKAIKKSIADKKKKKNLKEGREISGDQFTYGGFPRILTEMHESGNTHHDHMTKVFLQWQQMSREQHPNVGKFERAMREISSGNLNRADDLLALGADPDAVAGIVQTSPEHHAHRLANQPTDITNGGRWSGD